jgi:hypothetical protein
MRLIPQIFPLMVLLRRAGSLEGAQMALNALREQSIPSEGERRATAGGRRRFADMQPGSADDAASG